MQTITRLARVATLMLAGAASPSVAADDQSLAMIEQAAEVFIAAGQADASAATVSVRPIDRRLRLPRCATPLDSAWAPGSRHVGRVTVRVTCARPAWRLHVQADAAHEVAAWALVRGAARGAVLSSDMVTKTTVRVGDPAQSRHRFERTIRSLEPWLGLEFDRSVGGGEILSEDMLTAPALVRRGEEVALVHLGQALKVEARATALSDGVRDERIRVRNSRSGRIVEAVVTARGRVEAGF